LIELTEIHQRLSSSSNSHLYLKRVTTKTRPLNWVSFPALTWALGYNHWPQFVFLRNLLLWHTIIISHRYNHSKPLEKWWVAGEDRISVTSWISLYQSGKDQRKYLGKEFQTIETRALIELEDMKSTFRNCIHYMQNKTLPNPPSPTVFRNHVEFEVDVSQKS
jgi:hypothetical protein